jgi:hypothetical protein
LAHFLHFVKVAGAAGLEPVTSAVTGQRSNQLSYAPAWGRRTYGNAALTSSRRLKNIRAADAKEVGVGNPAEETYCYPNIQILCSPQFLSIPRQMMLRKLMHQLFQ